MTPFPFFFVSFFFIFRPTDPKSENAFDNKRNKKNRGWPKYCLQIRCNDGKQHHVMFCRLYLVILLLFIAQKFPVYKPIQILIIKAAIIIYEANIMFELPVVKPCFQSTGDRSYQIKSLLDLPNISLQHNVITLVCQLYIKTF